MTDSLIVYNLPHPIAFILTLLAMIKIGNWAPDDEAKAVIEKRQLQYN